MEMIIVGGLLFLQSFLMPEHSIIEASYSTACETAGGDWVNEHTVDSACINIPILSPRPHNEA